VTQRPPDDCRRALVTGATGFIGSRIAHYLIDKGIEVRALVRQLGFKTIVGCQAVRGDVADYSSLRSAFQNCDLVFHCAWGGASLSEARRINVDGACNVIAAAAATGVRRVVHLSSMAVHGRRLPPVLSENHPLCFRGDPYGLSKAEGEQAVLDRGAGDGVEVVVLRPTLVYGPRSPIWLISYFNRVKREQIALVNGGRGLANLVFIDDLLTAMWAAATVPDVSGQAFLISGEPPPTWREYIECFARMCGKPLPPSLSRLRASVEAQWMRVYSVFTRRPRRVLPMDLALMTQNTVVSTEKARRLLNYRPRVSLQDGMLCCETWLREEGYLPPNLRPCQRSPVLHRASGSTEHAVRV